MTYDKRHISAKYVWDWHVHTALFKSDNQQRPTLYHKNSADYSVRTYMGKEYEKEYEKEYIYTWITLMYTWT